MTSKIDKPYGKERKGMFQAIRNRIIKKKIGETMVTNDQQQHVRSKDLFMYLYMLDIGKEDECKDVKP